MATATGFAGRIDEVSERERTLARLGRLAHLLDTAVRIPGTGIRFGADSIVGLAPGVGDALTGLLSAYIVAEAWRLGLPRRKILRMALNVGLDSTVGAVPILGDLFDLAFKSNRRNLRIIEEHLGRSVMPPERVR